MHDMLSRRGFARLDMLQPTVAAQANTGDLAISFEYGLREKKWMLREGAPETL
jgi:hypothetical protein